MEQHKDALLKLLSDSKVLEEQVNLALEMLKKQKIEESDSDSPDADDTETLGEKLFSQVKQLDPERANDITGMLLEMNHTSLHQLLSDHSMLEVAVEKAQAALGT